MTELSLGFLMQMIGLTIDFFGALLLTVSEIRSRREIEEETTTCAGHNPAQVKAMKERSFLALFATVLLVLGFSLQIIGMLISQVNSGLPSP